MRADNTHHLREAVRQRQQRTRQRAEAALNELLDTDQAVTVALLARRAGVARSWVYSQPDLLARIQGPEPQRQPPPQRRASRPANRPGHDASTSPTSASANSPPRTSNSETARPCTRPAPRPTPNKPAKPQLISGIGQPASQTSMPTGLRLGDAMRLAIDSVVRPDYLARRGHRP